MTIITDTTENRITNYRNETYKQMLDVGEFWEQVLVDWLNSQGIEASRYDQNLSMLSKYSPLFSMFQRDIYITHPITGKRYNIEVKSRNDPWKYHSVHVGKCKSWDVKKYPVNFLVVIDQNTGDARITNASSMVRQAEWVRNRSNDLCYSVPRFKFSPLDALVDGLKKAPKL